MLEKFQLVAFKVEDAKSLKSVRKDFKNLKELELSMYDLEEESSSDEENDEDDSGLMGRSNIEVVSFFLQTAVNLKVKQKIRDSPFFFTDCHQVVKLHMNYGRHLNFSYLTSLLDRNPLIHTSHLHISRFKSLQIPIQKYDQNNQDSAYFVKN